jgi:hypothetical protein
VKDILNAGESSDKRGAKAYANPNVAFLFEDNFSVGTIHGANAPTAPLVPPDNAAAPTRPTPTGTPGNQTATIEILDDDAEEDVSVLTSKMQDELVALLVKARRQIYVSTGSWVASGMGTPPRKWPSCIASLYQQGPSADSPHQLCQEQHRRCAHRRERKQRAGWQIVTAQAPPVSTRRGTTHRPSGQCSGQVSSRQRRNQQRCAAF